MTQYEYKYASMIQSAYGFDPIFISKKLVAKYLPIIIDIFQQKKFTRLDTNDPSQLYLIGFYYKLEKDYEQAIKYFEISGKKNNIYALNELGIYYRDIEINTREMTKHFMKAIKLKSSEAMRNMAIYYKKNNNFKQMKRFLLLSIKEGNSNAMYDLGVNYFEISNNEKALKFLNMAKKNKNKSAPCELGNYYFQMGDFDNAIRNYEIGVDLGDIKSMCNAGLCYQRVKFIPVLMEHHYKLCIKTINDLRTTFNLNFSDSNLHMQTLSDVYNNYGFYYRDIHQFQLAEEYLVQSANLNNVIAMLNLYDFYDSIQINQELAKKYLHMSISLNYVESLDLFEKKIIGQYSLCKFYLELLDIKKNFPNSIDCVEDRIQIIENIDEIKIFKKKCELFKKLNNFNKCPNCLEDNIICICLDCGHPICIDCFANYYANPDKIKCYYGFCSNAKSFNCESNSNSDSDSNSNSN